MNLQIGSCIGTPRWHIKRLVRGLKPPSKAPVAQLDRAPDYESGGQRFESFRARHFLRKHQSIQALTTCRSELTTHVACLMRPQAGPLFAVNLKSTVQFPAVPSLDASQAPCWLPSFGRLAIDAGPGGTRSQPECGPMSRFPAQTPWKRERKRGCRPEAILRTFHVPEMCECSPSQSAMLFNSASSRSRVSVGAWGSRCTLRAISRPACRSALRSTRATRAPSIRKGRT